MWLWEYRSWLSVIPVHQAHYVVPEIIFPNTQNSQCKLNISRAKLQIETGVSGVSVGLAQNRKLFFEYI